MTQYTSDLVRDRALSFLRARRKRTNKRPFFMLLTPKARLGLDSLCLLFLPYTHTYISVQLAATLLFSVILYAQAQSKC